MKEGIKTDRYDLLSGKNTKESPLYASLYGARLSLQKSLGLKTLSIIQHDNDKRILEQFGSRYPYAFMRMTSLSIVKDMQNNRLIKRTGSMIQAEVIDTITIHKGYLFDAKINMELVFVTDQMVDALTYIEKLAILSATDSFTFTIRLPNSSEWQASIVFESEDFAIPQAVLEDEENPKALELNYSFYLKTKIGLIKQVSKINNEGRVDSTVIAGENDDAE